MKHTLYIYKLINEDSTLYFLNDDYSHRNNIELYDFKFYKNESELSSIKQSYLNKGFIIEIELPTEIKYKRTKSSINVGLKIKITSLETIMNQPEETLSRHLKSKYKEQIIEFKSTGKIKLYEELKDLYKIYQINLNESTKLNKGRLNTLKKIIQGKHLSKASKYRYKSFIKEFEETGKISLYEKFKDM